MMMESGHTESFVSVNKPFPVSWAEPFGVMFRLLAFLAITFLVVSEPGCFAFDGFTGKVVDSDTGQPIARAAVVAIYNQGRNRLFGGADSVPVDCKETLTDSNGEFKILRDSSQKDLRGRLEIFRPGYGNLFHERTTFSADGKEVNKSWPPSGKYLTVRLPLLKTLEERKRFGPETILFFHLPREKLPELSRLIDEDRASQGLRPHRDPTKRPENIIIQRHGGGLQRVAPAAK
jgi:hypothetical protein